MKKWIATIGLSIAAAVASACWFTESNFNATYIASVNGKVIHYTEASTISEATYHNGMQADLPITVQVKVSDRFGDQPDESGAKPITKAVLQYKVVKSTGQSGQWITVKTLDNPTWKMNFDHPVNLFGTDGKIDIAEGEIASGDDIIIRVWFTDGIYTTGDIAGDITSSQVPDTQTQSNISVGSDGWVAPHVFRVKYSGKRRLLI